MDLREKTCLRKNSQEYSEGERRNETNQPSSSSIFITSFYTTLCASISESNIRRMCSISSTIPLHTERNERYISIIINNNKYQIFFEKIPPFLHPSDRCMMRRTMTDGGWGYFLWEYDKEFKWKGGAVKQMTDIWMPDRQTSKYQQTEGEAMDSIPQPLSLHFSRHNFIESSSSSYDDNQLVLRWVNVYFCLRLSLNVIISWIWFSFFSFLFGSNFRNLILYLIND